MKHSLPWHTTTVGRIVRFLGGIQLAVPVLILTAAALAWGTYLESTQGSKVSRAMVYGSWWFILLMGLICVSLVFAVISRYPWRRKHVGFITVHAGLITLIIGGFWSMFERVEGHLTLEEGASGNAIELDDEVMEVTRFAAGKGTVVGSVIAPTATGPITLGPVQAEVVAHWANTEEQESVTDTGQEPFRAVLLTAGNQSGWVGDEAKTGGATTMGGMTMRVLAAGTAWEPPAAKAPEQPGYFFLVSQNRYPLGAEGSEAFPGWRIVSIKNFSHAMVSGSGLVEGEGSHANPAVDVTITNGQGTTERHTVFQNFPDMVISKALEGTATSGAKLSATATPTGAEMLVIYGPGEDPQAGYVAGDGTGKALGALGALPRTLDVGGKQVIVQKHFTKALATTQLVEAPSSSERRPAIVIKPSGSTETVVVPWKGQAQLPGGAGDLLVSYGPRTYPLPFSVKLQDFRKLDYPGTEMAMAYESDVVVSRDGSTDEPFRIFMNNPYAHRPWKVYQSGFVGEKVSVFSVMKDPGLPLTYIGSIMLCVGIFLTFYSRSLSWGHPGIPIEFGQKEQPHASRAVVSPKPVAGTHSAAVRSAASAGV